MISVIPNVKSPGSVSDVQLKDVLTAIQSGSLGGMDLIGLTTKIQSISVHTQQNTLKAQTLPLALYNGTFSYKNISGLKQYSNFTAIDLDGMKDKQEMDKTKASLVSTLFVYAVFTTPSGNGLKAIVMHDNTDPQYHEELFEQLLKAFIGCPYLDTSVKDVSRGHYICYDPDIRINKNVQPYHFVHDPNYVPKQTTTQQRMNNGMLPDLDRMRFMGRFKALGYRKGISDQSIINILNSCWKKDARRWMRGNRSNSIFQSATDLCKAGVLIDSAFNYLVPEYQKTGKQVNDIMYQAIRGYQMNFDAYGVNRSKFDGYASNRKKP